MSINETGAERPRIPGTPDIAYGWTDIVLRRNPEDIGKPIAEQHIKLSARCVGIVGDAGEPDPEESISISLTTDELRALSATLRNKIKAFVAVCEKGCTKQGQTYTDDFTI